MNSNVLAGSFPIMLGMMLQFSVNFTALQLPLQLPNQESIFLYSAQPHLSQKDIAHHLNQYFNELHAQEKREALVKYASKYLGLPYIYGGSTPRGFDCSGFTQFVFKEFGYDITRVPSGQVQFGTTVTKANAKKGDLVFYGFPSGNSYVFTHVAIVYDNTPTKGVRVIHSATPGLVISNIHCDPSPRTQLICIKRVIE